MKVIIALAISMTFMAQTASAASSVSGSAALALAALVSQHSPLLSKAEKKAMGRLFDGHLHFPWPATKTISVAADAVICRSSNVDITLHHCELRFGTKKKELEARQAHELYATIAEAGVPSDGAAGSIFEGLSHLACTIDPNAIKEKAGGGADCKFDPGAP